MIQFLIDENLSPRLVGTAQEFGFVAFHVAHRGWASLKDPQVLRRVLDENLTTVTNNWDDFRPMLARTEVHPGIRRHPPERTARTADRAIRRRSSALTIPTH
jgi:predicted nuclease of predicted toxin-antitoxin system